MARSKIVKGELLATGPTLESIGKAISQYYGGESVTLLPAGEVWHPADTYTGDKKRGVQVRKERGRYRFEMLPA